MKNEREHLEIKPFHGFTPYAKRPGFDHKQLMLNGIISVEM